MEEAKREEITEEEAMALYAENLRLAQFWLSIQIRESVRTENLWKAGEAAGVLATLRKMSLVMT